MKKLRKELGELVQIFALVEAGYAVALHLQLERIEKGAYSKTSLEEELCYARQEIKTLQRIAVCSGLLAFMIRFLTRTRAKRILRVLFG